MYCLTSGNYMRGRGFIRYVAVYFVAPVEGECDIPLVSPAVLDAARPESVVISAVPFLTILAEHVPITHRTYCRSPFPNINPYRLSELQADEPKTAATMSTRSRDFSVFWVVRPAPAKRSVQFVNACLAALVCIEVCHPVLLLSEIVLETEYQQPLLIRVHRKNPQNGRFHHRFVPCFHQLLVL